MNQFTRFDTKAADGVTITYERITTADTITSPADFDCYDADRIAAWNRGEWGFIGIRARAIVAVVRNGSGTYYTLDSAGLWGIEEDSTEDYLEEVFQEQRNELEADLKALAQMGAPA
jgi:hypothetical protein